MPKMLAEDARRKSLVGKWPITRNTAPRPRHLYPPLSLAASADFNNLDKTSKLPQDLASN